MVAASREGDSSVYSTPLCCCCNGIVADGRCIFRPRLRNGGIAGQARFRRLRRCRHRGLVLAGRAVEGRALARPVCRREAVRGRAFADRARWKGRVRLARAAGRPALFLVRRGRVAGRRHLAGEARRRTAAPSRARSRCAPMRRRGRTAPVRACGRCAIAGIAKRKTCIPPGSRSCSTRRSTTRLSWPALHVVLRDKSRNFLFNHLGLGEDEMGMVIRPDCADLPYFLRAYFAFKMGLPYGFSKCSRGGGGRGPHCVAWSNILNGETAANHTPVSVAAGGQNPEAVASISQSPEAAEAARARRILRPISAHPRRRRPFRIGPDGTERQQHRLLSRAADARDFAPGRRLRRSLRPRSDAGEAAAADQGGGRRHPRRRRAARRHGLAQALLARQFLVRAGSRARRSRLQALPADRARGERRPAPALPTKRSRRIRNTAISPSNNRSSGSKTFTTAWTT